VDKLIPNFVSNQLDWGKKPRPPKDDLYAGNDTFYQGKFKLQGCSANAQGKGTLLLIPFIVAPRARYKHQLEKGAQTNRRRNMAHRPQ